jgi:hypothetical protein
MTTQQAHPEWRMGQTMFNVAWQEPELRERTDALRGGSVDPFHDDNRCDAFLDAVFGADS